MQNFLSVLILMLLLFSCGEKETDREASADQTTGPVTANRQQAETEAGTGEMRYTTHAPCTFSVSLPSEFTMEEMYPDKSPDFCDYVVKTKDGTEVMELHSMLNTRFETASIQELYQAALAKPELEISYKVQKGNWFVISGTKKDGRIVYWKRVSGGQFISDLHIEYDPEDGSGIAPYIGTIAKSFESE